MLFKLCFYVLLLQTVAIFELLDNLLMDINKESFGVLQESGGGSDLVLKNVERYGLYVAHLVPVDVITIEILDGDNLGIVHIHYTHDLRLLLCLPASEKTLRIWSLLDYTSLSILSYCLYAMYSVVQAESVDAGSLENHYEFPTPGVVLPFDIPDGKNTSMLIPQAPLLMMANRM